MASETLQIAENREIASLVREKAKIEEKLSSAGGDDFGFLLSDCAELAGMIDGIDDVVIKMDEKQHAGFETKVKFSRKIRRKAKDLGNFEQKLVQEYDRGHIMLEHGRKMVEIIKLLRSKDVDKARLEARQFYEFLEMGARLEAIDDLLGKKMAQVERARRGILAQLEDLEWLEGQTPPDIEKVGRHETRERLSEKLALSRLRFIRHLQEMPVAKLLKKTEKGALEGFGFPKISAHDADSMAAFLQRSGLGTASAAQLLEMAGQSEQKLRHHGIDLAGFRQEIAGRGDFLSGIMALHPSTFMENISTGSPALDFLSAQSEEAASAANSLAELEKTAEQDSAECERLEKIKEKKASLEGTSKAMLEKSLKELESLKRVLDEKETEVPQEGTRDEKGKGGGILDSLLGLLKGK